MKEKNKQHTNLLKQNHKSSESLNEHRWTDEEKEFISFFFLNTPLLYAISDCIVVANTQLVDSFHLMLYTMCVLLETHEFSISVFHSGHTQTNEENRNLYGHTHAHTTAAFENGIKL